MKTSAVRRVVCVLLAFAGSLCFGQDVLPAEEIEIPLEEFEIEAGDWPEETEFPVEEFEGELDEWTEEIEAPVEEPGAEAGETPAEIDVPLAEPELAEDDAFTIAVVEDGLCPYFDKLTALVEKELAVLVHDEADVVFKRSPEFSGRWRLSRIRTAFENAMRDPEVDLVFAAGILVAQAATYEDTPLEKPVISGFVQDPDAVGLPYNEEGYSTKENFNFVVIPLRSSRDVAVFHDMIGFKHLGILVDEILIRGLSQLEPEANKGTEALGIGITLVPMNLSADEVLAGIDKPIDAVYLTPPLRMSDDEWQKVIDGVNRKGLPSFSLLGHQDVEAGALAGLAPDVNDRLARRLALNIQQIMLGTPPEELQVRMAVNEKLVINAKTAAQIGYSPSLEILMAGAEFLHREMLEKGEPLSLEQAVELALANNVDRALKRAEVESSRQDRNLALSTLLPQLEGNVTQTRVDDDSAETSGGALPEEETTAGFSVTQILYNDPAVSEYRAQKRAYQGSLHDEETTRLDVIESAARSYIQLLQARALLQIELDNLALTFRNREMARVRQDVGTAGPEEVYRWEAEAASQRATVIDSQVTVETAAIALNQVMGVDMNKRWRPEEFEFGEREFYFLGDRLKYLVVDQERIAAMEPFTAALALQNSPELQSLDKQVEAQKIRLSQAKRRYVVPELSASFTFDHTMDENVVGAVPAEPGSPTADDDEWVLALQASIPLFEGGGRHFDIAQSKALLEELEQTRESVAQYVEQRAKNAFWALDSSWPNMELQRVAAEFSRKNLEVIQDKYARGAVSILDLLDAQNQAFVANQSAAIAVYSYLEDLVEWQRVMCWFELEKTEPEKDAWAEAFRQFEQGKGVAVAPVEMSVREDEWGQSVPRR